MPLFAGVAQLVEQDFRKVKVGGSTPLASFLYFRGIKTALFRAQMKYGRSSISFEKPRALARGASLCQNSGIF